MKIDRFKKLSIIIFSIGFVFIIVGVSYAFFTYSKTGMYNQVIEGGRMGVVYNEATGNNVTLENVFPLTDEEALTDAKEFEWTVTGYNESFKPVYYAIEIVYGNTNTSKVRFKDSDIKLSLYENNNLVFENKIFDNLNKQDIYYGMFATGTSKETPTINNYKLRLWINDNVFITDTTDTIDTTGKTVYSSSAYSNLYASFKINVRANLNYMDTGYLTYDANGGKNAPEKTSLTTNKVTSMKPTMDGKGFLGWATSSDAIVPEYKSGDAYSGVGRTLYAVWSDTKNVMVTSFPTTISDQKANITEVYFVNDTQSNIDTKYNSASIKVDLTSSGSVKGWLEADANNSGKYILYIGSYGATYLTTAYNLFGSYTSLTKIDLSNVDTSSTTNMSAMFNGCSSLTTIDVSHFDTSNVKTMSLMFSKCSSLVNLDVSNFVTNQVTNLGGMFTNCSKLASIDVSRFDTSKVTDMNSIFNACSSLKSIDLSNFVTTNLTNMAYMFSNCSGLTSLDLSSFTTGKVTSMSYIFSGCKNITVLNISSFDLSDSNTVLTRFGSMFNGMSSSCQVKVKDTNAQSWVLSAENAHPTSWSTSNVLVQA